MPVQRFAMLFAAAFILTVGFAYLTPWPAYALAPAILAPFSVLLIVGLATASLIAPKGKFRKATQGTTIFLIGMFAASLFLLMILRGS